MGASQDEDFTQTESASIVAMLYKFIEFWKNGDEAPTFCPSSVGLKDSCSDSCKNCKQKALTELGEKLNLRL